jgi:predicted O-methyltransferase YrrM
MPFSLASELERSLTPDAEAFEYGSGGSTLWLAKRVGGLTSVEHHAGWHARVEEELRQAGLTNCSVELYEPTATGNGASDGPYRSPVVEGNFQDYVKAISSLPDDSLDLVLVDGRCRVECVLRAMTKVKPGGMLILDDSDRKRYASAREELKAWPRREFWGIKPFTLEPAHTTVWTKPATASRVREQASARTSTTS